MAASGATVHHVSVDEEARLTPDVEIANDHELVLLDKVQRRFPLASLADAEVGVLPGDVKGVAIVDAFALVNGNAIGDINDDFDRGGSHGTIRGRRRMECFRRTRQLHLRIPPAAVSSSVAPKNGGAGFRLGSFEAVFYHSESWVIDRLQPVFVGYPLGTRQESLCIARRMMRRGSRYATIRRAAQSDLPVD